MQSKLRIVPSSNPQEAGEVSEGSEELKKCLNDDVCGVSNHAAEAKPLEYGSR